MTILVTLLRGGELKEVPQGRHFMNRRFQPAVLFGEGWEGAC